MLVCVGDSLSSIARASLHEDVVHVRLDRDPADEEPLGDLSVREARRHETQDVALRVPLSPSGNTPPSRMDRQPSRNQRSRAWTLRVEHSLSGRGSFNGAGDVVAAGVLREVPNRSRLQGADDRLVVGVRREHDDLDVLVAVPDRRVASMPSTPGIRRSMSTTSGSTRSTSATAASPSSAVPTTSIPCERAEQGLEALTHRGLVVDDNDPHVGTATRRSTRRLRSPARTEPPSGSMRSRIPRRP